MKKGYKKIELYIPEDQRLGQAIMNGFRKKWFVDGDDNHKYWDIFELDTKDIQEAIDDMGNKKRYAVLVDKDKGEVIQTFANDEEEMQYFVDNDLSGVNYEIIYKEEPTAFT